VREQLGQRNFVCLHHRQLTDIDGRPRLADRNGQICPRFLYDVRDRDTHDWARALPHLLKLQQVVQQRLQPLGSFNGEADERVRFRVQLARVPAR
jgi:hypothetical protein